MQSNAEKRGVTRTLQLKQILASDAEILDCNVGNSQVRKSSAEWFSKNYFLVQTLFSQLSFCSRPNIFVE